MTSEQVSIHMLMGGACKCNPSLPTHFRIAVEPEESFTDTYRWVNVTFLDRLVYVTGYIYFEGIYYMGFHLD